MAGYNRISRDDRAGVLSCGRPDRIDVMAAFTLAHLSDPHLPPLPAARLRDLDNKRALGYLNWRRNRRKFHRRDVLDALVSDIRTQTPDHIAVTGDLVNLSLEAEFAPARAWLESVGTPDRVTVIPGNHDAYVRATQHRFAETLGNYLDGDDAPHRGRSEEHTSELQSLRHLVCRL